MTQIFPMVILKPINILILTLVFTQITFSQTREELERKRKQKEEEIRLTKKLLQETEAKQKQSVEYLQVLNNQISIRENIILSLKQEIKYLNEEIADASQVVSSLQKDLANLKKEYASMVRFAFKTRNSYNKLGFILSAKTFNQSYKRMKLLQHYSEYRKKQMKLIVETEQSVKQKIAELQAKMTEKNVLAIQQDTEKQNLEKDKISQNQTLENLKKKESQLRKDLAQQEKMKAELNRQIEELIRREINKSTTKTAGTTKFEMTPEAKKLSADFAGNKGKLPWPVEKGVISEYYGTHEHPVLKGVEIVSNGIKIMTDRDGEVRAIFSGTVTNVLTIPGAGKSILINHGEFYTVYSNLEEVYVRSGQKVTTKQKLGKIRFDQKSGKTEMELQIWKMTTKQDPLLWLMKA